MSRVGDVKAAATQRWEQARLRYAWLAHAVQAWEWFRNSNAGQYAAAITYFSFLALFPLLLLAVSVFGFVLHARPELLTTVLNSITENIPGELGTQINNSLKAVIRSRASFGLIGLFGVLLTGLGWIGNIRLAINGVWRLPRPQQNYVILKIKNLFVLAGLGLAVLISIGLGIVGTAVTQQVIDALNLGSSPWVTFAVKATTIAIAVLGDMVILGWLLIRLPGVKVPWSILWRTALLAAVGFEVLKIVGTYTIAKSTHSATLGPFASLLAVLIWVQLVCRYLLYCASWAATAVAGPPVADPEPPICGFGGSSDRISKLSEA